MTVVTPEEIMEEFKQFLKNTRLVEKEKNKNEKEAMALEQVKRLVGD
tara:strand:+ start:387 stop:527 length:141 start_codon:yes stop_codon:yes gene_type:complete